LITIPLLELSLIQLIKKIGNENWNYLDYIILIGSLPQIISSPV
jgi:hypothetical protein